MDREEVIERLRKTKEMLRKKLKNFKHLYLVGSYAKGDWVKGLSDVDVIVVSDDFRDKTLVRRIREIAEFFDFEAVDIIPLTSEEFERSLKEPCTVREMMKTAVEI